MKAISKIPLKKLWNPKSFIIFSVFFSFLLAGIMCALNYGRAGDQRKKMITLLSTILGFIVLITIVSIFSINVPIIFFPINVGVGIFLMTIQRKLYEEHIQSGGERDSYFLPLIIGIILFSLSAASILYNAYVPQNSLDYNNNHLFYTNAITESQAKELQDYLKAEKYFTSTSEIDIKIDKEKDLYLLSLVVKDEYLDSQEFINAMKAFSKELSQNVFENNKVRINFCNDRFKVLKYTSAD